MPELWSAQLHMEGTSAGKEYVAFKIQKCRYSEDLNKPGEVQFYIGDKFYTDQTVVSRLAQGKAGQ